jgi:hypothetical protein
MTLQKAHCPRCVIVLRRLSNKKVQLAIKAHENHVAISFSRAIHARRDFALIYLRYARDRVTTRSRGLGISALRGHGIMTLPWGELALFMIAIVFIALYSLTVSGHFQAEIRTVELQTGNGAKIMWETLVACSLRPYCFARFQIVS